MRYKCPSCFVNWRDSLKPIDFLKQNRCQFCSNPHTEQELFEWQRDQFKHISETDRFAAYNRMLQSFYRHFQEELDELKELLEKQKS